MNQNLIQKINILGIDEEAVRLGFDKTAPVPQGVIALRLSERPNQFFISLFLERWAARLQADVTKQGLFAEAPGLTPEERVTHRNNAYDLRRRIQNPADSCAPIFEGTSRIMVRIEWAKLYGGLPSFIVRIVETINDTNEGIPFYGPLLAQQERNAKEQLQQEQLEKRIQELLSTVQAALNPSDAMSAR